MMHGHEKSSSAIVAVKPTNKVEHTVAEQSATEQTAAEPVEPRAEAEGNGRPAQHAPGTVPGTRAPGAGLHTAQHRRGYPRWEPYAGKLQVRVCAGGARQLASLPRRAPGKDGAIQPVQVRPKLKGSVLLGSECCVATGDSGCEAYTAIAWGVGLSHEGHTSQGPRVFIRSKA